MPTPHSHDGVATAVPGARQWAELLRRARQGDEPYSAAALYPAASARERSALAAQAFSSRRHRLTLAGAPFVAPAVLDAIAHDLADEALKLRLARNPATPGATLTALWRTAVKADRLSRLLARHRRTPQVVLAEIAASVDEVDTLRALCENAGAGADVLDAVHERHSGVFRRVLAVNLATQASTLRALWDEGSEDAVRMQILLHPHCPPELLETLPESPLQRRGLAQQPRTPASVLSALASDVDVPVRRAAAANAATPIDALAHALTDADAAVRRVLAARRDLPPQWVEHLAVDADEWVRRNLGRNPACDAAVLARLATDSATEVRRSVARHPHCPPALQEGLAADPEPWVQAAVAYRDDLAPRLLRRLARSTDVDVLAGVARSTSASPYLLRRLAGHESDDVRRAVILNPQAPLAVLRVLSRDPYALHRAMVVEHANFSPAARWRMRADPDVQVRYRVFAFFARSKLQSQGADTAGAAPAAIVSAADSSPKDEKETR